MQFCSLGSGSKGNATLIKHENDCLLIDCGFSAKELEQRLELVEASPQSINAIFVTHEHSDHIKGVGAVARRWRIPVWMTHGTYRASRVGDIENLHLFHPDLSCCNVGSISVYPVAVPHDAREPCQYIIEADAFRFGILTDLGCATPHIVEQYQAMDALLLECNHDLDMLKNGPYPASLQARVRSDFGHLNNQQSAWILREIYSDRLKLLVLAHMSEKNNSAQKVEEEILRLPEISSCTRTILKQDVPSEWFDIKVQC